VGKLMSKKTVLLGLAFLNTVFSYYITNETKSMTNWRQVMQSYPGYTMSDVSNIITASESDSSTWRNNARSRIENNRKKDITFDLKDKDGNPLPDMTVSVELLKHDFIWGGIISGRNINGENACDPNDVKTLFRVFFNAGGFQNALKIKLWNANNEDRVTAATNFWNIYDIPYRGHTLMWPRPNNIHSSLVGYVDADWDKQLVKNARKDDFTNDARVLIQDHIAKFDIYEWDVVNEPRTCLLWTNYPGYDALKGFFDDAYAAKYHPSQKLFVNDWGILGRDWPSNEDWYETTISDLLALGTPLDGIGFQGRGVWLDWTSTPTPRPSANQYYTSLKRFADAFPTLDLSITEFEINYSTNDPADPDVRPTVMEEYIEAAFSESRLDAMNSWIFFGDDGTSEYRQLVNYDGSITKFGQIWLYSVRYKFTTETNGQSDNGGDFAFRGFPGEYMVTISNGAFVTNLFVYTTNTETIPIEVDYTRQVAKAPVIFLRGENNLLDTSSNGNVHDGFVIDTAPSYAAGIDGNAIELNGTDNSFGITHDNEMEGSFTLTFWLDWGSTGGGDIAISKGLPYNNTEGGFQIGVRNSGGWKLSFWGRTNGGTPVYNFGSVPSTYEQVGLTYDKPSGVMNGYFNGILVFTLNDVIHNTVSNIVFGKRTGTDYGNCFIDHFKYFDTAFSPGEMQWLYENDFSNVITNSFPSVSSTAPFAFPGIFYTYVIEAADPDADYVSIDVVNAPVWMSFNTSTFEISGTPTAGDLGTNWISVELDDGKNEIITNQHYIVVKNNIPPYVTSIPASNGFPGEGYVYTITFGDDDGDVVNASLISAPGWMNWDSTNSILNGSPTYANVGSNAFTYSFTDGKAVLTNTQYIYIDYNPGGRLTTPPIVKLEFENDLLDTSSNGNVHNAAAVDGLVTNYVSGTNGNALSMDGANLSYGVSHDSEFEGSFTMTFWVSHPGTLTDSSVVLSKGNPWNGSGGFQITINNWSGWNYVLWGRTNTGSVNLTLGSMNAGGFDHIGLVYDKPNSVYHGYFNGLLSFTISNVTDVNTDDILFGKRTGTDFGNAVVDHFKYYDQIFAEPVMLGLYSNDFSNMANYPPLLLSSAPAGYTNTLYTYVLDFTNYDSDVITPSFPVLPAWLTYTSSNQTLSGIPGSGDFGSNELTILLDDGTDSVYYYQYIVITNNNPPVLTSTPSMYAPKDQYYSYVITYDDIDSVTVSVTDIPSWMVYTNSTITLSVHCQVHRLLVTLEPTILLLF
jgi:GH35 family endo-1,4-beta-xylanase